MYECVTTTVKIYPNVQLLETAAGQIGTFRRGRASHSRAALYVIRDSPYEMNRAVCK